MKEAGASFLQVHSVTSKRTTAVKEPVAYEPKTRKLFSCRKISPKLDLIQPYAMRSTVNSDIAG